VPRFSRFGFRLPGAIRPPLKNHCPTTEWAGIIVLREIQINGSPGGFYSALNSLSPKPAANGVFRGAAEKIRFCEPWYRSKIWPCTSRWKRPWKAEFEGGFYLKNALWVHLVLFLRRAFFGSGYERDPNFVFRRRTTMNLPGDEKKHTFGFNFRCLRVFSQGTSS